MQRRISTTNAVTLFRPHPAQAQVLAELDKQRVRYVVLACGRRFGKTELAINAMVYYALGLRKQSVLYMSQKGDQRATTFADFLKLFEEAPFVKEINRTQFRVTLCNGSEILFRLASKPAVEGIRGKRFTHLFLDECALYDADVFDTILEPTLATQKYYKVVMMSTPRGRGQFFSWYQRGLDKSQPAWRSFKAPSTANPLVSKEFVESVRQRVPDRVFRQEYLAEFVDDAASVFCDVRKASVRKLSEVKPTGPLWAGVDLGFVNDSTVLTVIDKQGVVYQDRFNGCTMFEGAKRVYDGLKRFGFPQTFVESNTYQGFAEELKRLGAKNVSTFTTTGSNKSEMVEDLAFAIERGEMQLMDDDYSVSEFESFEYRFDPKSRRVSYGAPSGAHDDIVMSTCIALACRRARGSGIRPVRIER